MDIWSAIEDSGIEFNVNEVPFQIRKGFIIEYFPGAAVFHVGDFQWKRIRSIELRNNSYKVYWVRNDDHIWSHDTMNAIDKIVNKFFSNRAFW